MTSDWPDLPSWVPASAAAVLTGETPDEASLACVFAGKLLRAVTTSPALATRTRSAIAELLSSERARSELAVDAAHRGDEAVLAAERVASDASSGALSHQAIASAALLRDDIEAMRVCIGVVLLDANAGDPAARDDWHELDISLASYAATVDVTVAPVLDDIRRAWLGAADAITPEELAALVSAGSNPWWLDPFDPVWRQLPARVPEAEPLLLAAGVVGIAQVPAREWRFERGITAELMRRHDGSYRLRLRGQALATAQNVVVSWMVGTKREKVEMRPIVQMIRECTVGRSVLDSPVVYLVIDGRLVVKEPA